MIKEKDKINAEDILASLSPIITTDTGLTIRFSNSSFRRTFRFRSPEGKNLADLLKLNNSDKEIILENIKKSVKKKIENAEFYYNEKTIGYSIFRTKSDIVIILKDITEIKSLEERVSNLHSRLLEIQEKERQSIASELHDSVGQTVLAAKLNFSNYLSDPIKNEERFEAGMKLIDLVSQEIRDLYTSLYPSTLNDLGLEATLRWYTRNFLEVKKIKTIIEIDINKNIDRRLQVSLFRIFQELTSNIVKHSHADTVNISLKEYAGKVRLQVSDNGVGFDLNINRKPGRHYGLENIRTRIADLGGYMEIESKKGKGVSFYAEVPV
jgi:signal transduction histidine kinase